MGPEIQANLKPRRSRFKKFLWTVLFLVLALGGTYLGARFQMQARVNDMQEQLTSGGEQVAIAQQRLASEHQRVTELEGRRRIHLAIMDFDQNNFGTAREQLRAAAALLDATPGNAELAALARSLRTIELAPSLDLPTQRAALLQLATKFDALRPPMPVAP
jgi:hypothetical protein